MYKKSLNKIISMVKISEAFDREGYVEESAMAMYNAFELAEDTAYKMAEELNSMVKTASKNTQGNKLAELENMRVITAGIGSWLWNDVAKPGLGWLGNKAKNLLGVGQKAIENKALNKAEQLGGEKGTQYLEKGLLPKIGEGLGQAANWAGQHPIPAGGIAAGAGLGAGALALHELGNRGNNQPSPIQLGPGGTPIPSATSPTGGTTPMAPGAMTPATSGVPQASTAEAAQISAIDQRINNLEQVVQAIRAKVGV